jgi:hypothetical protein
MIGEIEDRSGSARHTIQFPPTCAVCDLKPTEFCDHATARAEDTLNLVALDTPMAVDESPTT